MKLSNKILIGFFGFIFIYMTAAFSEIRFRGTPARIDDSNSIAETIDIPGITYLVLQDLDQNIKVIGSDQPRIEVRSTSGDMVKKLKYNISNDTLTLLELEKEENNRVYISVYVPLHNFKGMAVNGAEVIINALEQKVLSISQKSGIVRLIDNNNIGKLHIEASDMSYFEMSNAEVDTFSAQADNSELLIYSPVRLLKGTMKNDSYIRMAGIEEVQFKKDESSTLHFY